MCARAKEGASAIRCTVLYACFPYDRSIWRCVKEPLWIIFAVAGLLPVIGPLWWLFVFALKDKSNQHTLVDFIVSCKTAQFFGLGLGSTTIGVVRYVFCTLHDPPLCHLYGPQLDTYDGMFFLLQISLVWAALAMLPKSKRGINSGNAAMVEVDGDIRSTGTEFDECTADGTVTTRMSLSAGRVTEISAGLANDARMRSSSTLSPLELARRLRLSFERGGLLVKTFWYDSMLLGLSVSVACVAIAWQHNSVAAARTELWKTAAILYWLRAIYGILSLPFVFFKLPLLGTALTRTQGVGYDQFGATRYRTRDPYRDTLDDAFTKEGGTLGARCLEGGTMEHTKKSNGNGTDEKEKKMQRL